MKKIISIVMAITLLLCGCGNGFMSSKKKEEPKKTQYTATFLELFDTVTTIVGYAENEETFRDIANEIKNELEEYHKLFDIYHDYEGISNVKTINDNAGIAPVETEERLTQFLLDCKEFYASTDGLVNVAMGSVLSLWHEARNTGRDNPKEARLPDKDKLAQAAEHMDFEAVVIDEAASTVYIEDPMVQLDVGAVAKGWSVQRIAENAPKGLLISVGGNVCATGPKDEQGTAWVVGIQNPDMTENFLHTVYAKEESVVTSGDYQRAYTVDGKLYHHIIDPKTLYPSKNWRSVTIICKDSGVADALSTALFLLPQEEGQKLLEQYHAEAMWVDAEGDIFYSTNFQKYIRT